MPRWVWTEDVLTTAGRWLALVHEASAGFATADAVWQLPAREPVEVICLNDVAPYNMVFDDAGELTGWIDVDTASPGPRVWDLAHLAYRLVPLTGSEDTGAGAPDVARCRRRLTSLCEAYAVAGERVDIPPAAVLDSAVTRLHALAALAARCAAGGAGHVAPHVQGYLQDAAWVEQNTPQLAPKESSHVRSPPEASGLAEHR
jgi:aminoglycoside phosphotransferase (APT) family kinase protein